MSLLKKAVEVLSKAGEADELEKAALTTKERDALPASDFIFPETREYPYHDASHARNALSRGAQHETGARLATIKRKVHARYPNIGDDMEKAEFTFDSPVPLWKDDAKQITYGIVLHPDTVDSQGDIVSKAEIEQAAHRYLVESRRADIQHSETPADIEVVESYVAPQDMTIAGQPVLKGSWVMAHHVKDPEVWKGITEGKLTGLSIGGSGVRVPDAS